MPFCISLFIFCISLFILCIPVFECWYYASVFSTFGKFVRNCVIHLWLFHLLLNQIFWFILHSVLTQNPFLHLFQSDIPVHIGPATLLLDTFSILQHNVKNEKYDKTIYIFRMIKGFPIRFTVWFLLQVCNKKIKIRVLDPLEN